MQTRGRPRFALRTLSATMAIVLAVDAGAQAPLPELPPGTRVRVRVPRLSANEMTGNLWFSGRDTLILGRRGGTLHIPRADLTKLEISQGRSHLVGALKGTMWGALLGPVTLGTIGLLIDLSSEPAEGQIVGATAAGVVVGTLLVVPAGAIIGAIRGSERWRTSWER